ncbi:hypothetical protein [Pedobacter panaciterrae]
MGFVNIGLNAFKFAPLESDGGPGTVFVSLGSTSKGTFSFEEDDPTEKRVEIEESPDPLRVFKRQGARRIKLSIPDPDVDALAMIRGGTVTTATGKKTYTEDNAVSLEGTVQVIPEEGFDSIQYNHVSIFGKLNGALGQDQELLLELTVDILKPAKAGVKTMTIIQDAPTP